MLPRCSPEDIRDIDDHNFADSGETLQRRTVQIRRLNKLQSNSFISSWQSSGDSYRGLGQPLATARNSAEARVSGSEREELEMGKRVRF
jgi:hypothetical protein